MNDTQQVAKRERDEVQQHQSPSREHEHALVPAADVVEDADGISVVLDLPGVSKDRLHVKADGNSLVVEGDAEIPMPEGMEAVYADVHAAHYRRSFGLTSELDAERIEAGLKDGVLTLRIPKRAELKPRRIEINSD